MQDTYQPAIAQQRRCSDTLLLMNGHDHSGADEPLDPDDGHQPELPWNLSSDDAERGTAGSIDQGGDTSKPQDDVHIASDAFAAPADTGYTQPLSGWPKPSGTPQPAAASEAPQPIEAASDHDAPGAIPPAEPSFEPESPAPAQATEPSAQPESAPAPAAAPPVEPEASTEGPPPEPAEAEVLEAAAPHEAAEAPSAPARLLDRERPKRRPLVAGRTIAIVAGVLVGIALLAAGIAWFIQASRVTVPDFRDKPLAAARVEASRAGVNLVVSARRFSPTAPEQVLEQDPAPDTKVRRGSTVSVVISAGTEQFALPDVTGVGIALARGQLETRGLRVEVVTEASGEPSGTVLAMNPSPNSPVQTGDTVRLTVATATSNGTGLRPFKLQGRVFVLDPAPAAPGAADTPMDITRRVRALLEASGATVSVTRSATETDIASSERARKTRNASPDGVVGLTVSTTTTAGISVLRSTTGDPTKVQTSTQLQTDVIDAIAAGGYQARQGTTASDGVLNATKAPSVRVVLGSVNSEEDRAAFRDPKWADSIARAIYLVLGERFAGS
ncbi:MAG: PASTA domain-containing protein [Coriobacteriales bacterium]|nr:PASTA domain-containing protein [Coriobacteriales bacterium]